ncbi:unnamed protein product [Onchocerca ochengi]|uniref:ZP domain-containing protein n=1 Tax=Onchocerca ochengi TaxID=42157 RepID=A0A182EM43_ONCOC|nr:unnamed protein product [Onchocerca ochengi]
MYLVGLTELLTELQYSTFMCALYTFNSKGYSSFPASVLDINARGYRSQHFPSIMHGDFAFKVLQGPCIIFFATTLYKSLSTSGSGISAHITFCLKIRAVMSCLFIVDCPGNKRFCISSQAGLHVNVMDRAKLSLIQTLKQRTAFQNEFVLIIWQQKKGAGFMINLPFHFECLHKMCRHDFCAERCHLEAGVVFSDFG